MMRGWLAGILGVLCFGAIGCLGSGIDLTDGNEDCEVGRTFYADYDGDGHGDPNDTVEACVAPEMFVADDTDCNPIDPSAFTGAEELCGDKVDNDCLGGDPCLLSLVGHWSFDDPTGEIASDATGNNPGELRNGLTNLTGSMLVFDGQDDYVMVPDSPLLQASVGTIAFWFNPTLVGGVEQGLLSRDSGGRDAGGHITFYLTDVGSIRVRMQSNQADYEIESLPIMANQWHHVVFTYGGNEGMAMVVNGVQVGQDPYTGGLNTALEPLVIGASSDNSGNQTAEPISEPFQGIIADVRFYDRQLVAKELLDLRTTTAPDGAGI